jgi:hypothetical protein
MMDCLETRNEFPALWRKTATIERRAEAMAHVASCTKCDRAFRVFAMTAPVLHAESEPAEVVESPSKSGREFSAYDRPHRSASTARVERSPRRWLAMAAAAAIFVLASGAAYFSERSPNISFNDALLSTEVGTNSEAAADPFAPELPTTESDLAS